MEFDPQAHFEKIQKNIQGKKDRASRAATLRGEIVRLNGELERLREIPPVAEGVAEVWKAQLDGAAQDFVFELNTRASTGKSPQIRLDQPGAIAYFCKDLVLAAIPELAMKVTGSQGISFEARAQKMQQLDGELLAVRRELAGLGG